jgi:histone acetyltransferase (RNA polymerase elongator complex component)
MLEKRSDDMNECKHGLRSGCVYCHARVTSPATAATPKRRTRATRLSEQMNDRMTTLKKRLREIRGG